MQPHRPVNHLAGPSQGLAPDEPVKLGQPRPRSTAKSPEPSFRCVHTQFTQTDYPHAYLPKPMVHLSKSSTRACKRKLGVHSCRSVSAAHAELMFIWKPGGDLRVIKHDQSCPMSAHCSLLHLSYHAQALCSLHPVFLKLFRGRLISLSASVL